MDVFEIALRRRNIDNVAVMSSTYESSNVSQKKSEQCAIDPPTTSTLAKELPDIRKTAKTSNNRRLLHFVPLLLHASINVGDLG